MTAYAESAPCLQCKRRTGHKSGYCLECRNTKFKAKPADLDIPKDKTCTKCLKTLEASKNFHIKSNFPGERITYHSKCKLCIAADRALRTVESMTKVGFPCTNCSHQTVHFTGLCAKCRKLSKIPYARKRVVKELSK